MFHTACLVLHQLDVLIFFHRRLWSPGPYHLKSVGVFCGHTFTRCVPCLVHRFDRDEQPSSRSQQDNRQDNPRGPAVVPRHRPSLDRNDREQCTHGSLRYIKSASSSSRPAPFLFSSSMLMPRPLISLQSTSNDTGVPASSVFVPFTMLSQLFVRPSTSSDLTVSSSCTM